MTHVGRRTRSNVFHPFHPSTFGRQAQLAPRHLSTERQIVGETRESKHRIEKEGAEAKKQYDCGESPTQPHKYCVRMKAKRSKLDSTNGGILDVDLERIS